LSFPTAVYYLATLDPVSRDELILFGIKLGGNQPPNPAFDVGFRATPWGGLSVEWATDAKAKSLQRKDRLLETKRGARASQEAHDAVARITEILGGPPHDFVELYLTRGQESQRFATAFVEAFAKRWSPCALESSFTLDVAEGGKKVWTMDELLEFARREHRLPTIRQDIENWFEFFLEKYRMEQAEEGEYLRQ